MGTWKSTLTMSAFKTGDMICRVHNSNVIVFERKKTNKVMPVV
jgi:hypothetical protein